MYLSHLPNPGNQMSFSEETALLPFLIPIIHSLSSSHTLPTVCQIKLHTLHPHLWFSGMLIPSGMIQFLPGPAFLLLLSFDLVFSPLSVLQVQCHLTHPWICQSQFHLRGWSYKSLFLEYFSSRSGQFLFPPLHLGLCMSHSFKVISWLPFPIPYLK